MTTVAAVIAPAALTVDESTRYASIGRTTLYAEIKAGRLPAFTAAGRRLIYRNDLDAWLAAEAAKSGYRPLSTAA
jgi:excisionase family DNA binding protein